MIRFITLVAAFLMSVQTVGAVEARLARMGTGNVAGVYFPVGIALCRLVNQHRHDTGLRCAAEISDGSVANIDALRAGRNDLGIVQSDTQETALRGTEGFAPVGPFSDLRAVMSLFPEPLVIVARPDAGVKSLDDLKGKRVSIGNPGSGQRVLMDVLMAKLGWTLETFGAVSEIPPETLATALCSGQIDAFVFAIGQPALVIQEATNQCGAVLSGATGPEVDALVAGDPAYFATTVPGGLYAGNPTDIKTFGTEATLVTRANVPDDVIYQIVKSIFDDFDTLTNLNPVLSGLDPKLMVHQSLTAPLHPGAERYYREKGWLN